MRLQLHFPVLPYFVNQHFGANIPCVQNFGTSSQKIVDGADNATCPVGYDKLYQHFGMSGHNGIDLRAGQQPVYASQSGVVVEQQIVPSRGLGLGILTNTPVDLDSYGTHYVKVRYWHLLSFNVKVGATVNVGDVIGISDSTGYSAGSHLHFEIQPMDKDAGGHPVLVNPAGSIAGAIDPEPFFIGPPPPPPTKLELYQKLVATLKLLIIAMTKRNAGVVG